MKKTENVFKFVAIRNPKKSKESSVNFSEDSSFIYTVRRRVDNTRSFEEARLEVATEYINSERYVTRNPWWRKLLPLEPLVVQLLKRASNSDRTFLIREIERLLSQTLNSRILLQNFVESDTFRQKKQDLWHSYYSNLMLNYRRSQDRETLTFWIKFFELLQHFQNDSKFFSLLQNFDTLRLAVPLELLRRTESVGGDSPASNEDLTSIQQRKRREEVQTVKDDIEQLKTAKTEIERVFRAKLQAYRAEAQQRELIGTENLIDSAVEDSPPWRLKADELQNTTRQTLTHYQLEIENSTVPEIKNALGEMIAKKYATLRSLQRVEEVVNVGGVWIRRFRTERY